MQDLIAVRKEMTVEKKLLAALINQNGQCYEEHPAE